MSHHFRVSNLCADSKPCRSLRNIAACFAHAKWFLPPHAVNHFRCGKQGMMYLLDRSRRPRLFRPARFKKRGGRANRRRCARWRRFPSDCRSKPHSNMRNVVLCRNFSRWAFVSRSLRTREIRNGPTGKRKAKHPNGLKKRAERSGIASERFQASGVAG